MLDNLSGGRIEIGVGMGYAPHEFRGFGIPLPQRLSRMEEGLEILTRCFTGERFSFHGKRYDFDDVVIRPRYVQPGGPPLWIAAMSASGAARAARFDAHLLPQGERAQVLDPWREAVRAAGRARRTRAASASSARASSPTIRERDWPAVRAAEHYRGELYNRFFAESGQERSWYRAGERIPQTWVVGSVDHCVAELGGVHRRARDHRPGDVGGAAGPPAGADEPKPGTIRPRSSAAPPRPIAADRCELAARRSTTEFHASETQQARDASFRTNRNR